MNPSSSDFDAVLLTCLLSSASDDLKPALLTARRFSGMGRIGKLCSLIRRSFNTTSTCFYQISFEQVEVDRLHLPSNTFRVELFRSHPLRRLSRHHSLLPLHGMISSDGGTALLRDQPTRFALQDHFDCFRYSFFVFLRFLSESESLFLTNGSSVFVVHNGERLLSFSSAVDRDSAAASLNRALWQPPIHSSLPMQPTPITAGHVHGLFCACFCIVFFFSLPFFILFCSFCFTASSLTTPVAHSIQVETTETAILQQHQGLYTIIDGPYAQGSDFFWNIRGYLGVTSSLLSHYSISAVTQVSGRDGRNLASIEEWDNCFDYKGSVLLGSSCWDFQTGCSFFLTTGSNPSGNGPAALANCPKVLSPVTNIPVLMNVDGVLSEIYYTDLDNPPGDGSAVTLQLSNPSSSLFALDFDGSWTLLSPDLCNQIESSGGHVPYYDLHPIDGCWTDQPSTPDEALLRLALFWNNTLVKKSSTDVVLGLVSCYFQHFQAEWGADLSMTEVGENTGLINSRMAFTRGSGAQYLKAWGLGLSSRYFYTCCC